MAVDATLFTVATNGGTKMLSATCKTCSKLVPFILPVNSLLATDAVTLEHRCPNAP